MLIGYFKKRTAFFFQSFEKQNPMSKLIINGQYTILHTIIRYKFHRSCPVILQMEEI